MSKKIMSIILTACMMLTCLSVSFTAQAVTTDAESVSASIDTESVSADYGLCDDVQDGQILQCWNWSYNGIKNNMQKIAEQGFTAVQTSPIQTTKESTQGKTMAGSWWVFYQPSNFTIETSSQNALGTKTEFKAMCEEAHKYGVKVIVDAVLNHMANKTGNDLSDTIPSDIKNDSSCWHDISKNSWYDSRYDITQYCMDGLPDLNTSNSKVQNYAISFLKECIDAGADGFRFDGAKHIETPVDSGCSSQFWPNVLNATTSYAKSTRGITPYYYGEVLDKTTGNNDQGSGSSVVSSYTSYMSITMSSVSNSIRNSVNSNDASGAKGSDFYLDDGSSVAGTKAVLWNESHDTYANGSSSGQSDTTMKKTWAMVGSRANACSMYLARPTSTGSTIGTASVTAWGDAEVKAVNQFKNYFAGQSEYLSTSGSIAYNERGTSGVVLVNLGGSSTSVSVTANKMAAGTYIDQITGNTFTVSGGKISGNIGSTGIAVVYNAVTTPKATVTPGSKNYNTDTLTLTLNYSNATSGQYSIDGGSYTSYTDGKTITIGSGLAYGTKTTVSVKASDGSTTSDPVTYTYTKVDPSLTQKVYFDNSSYNWSSVYAYIYDETSSTEVSAWPGVKMTLDSSTGYYVTEVPAGFENGLVIFTESSTATTNRYPADMEPGLELNGDTKLFKSGNTWVSYTPVVTTTATPSTTVTVTQATTASVPSNRILIGDANLSTAITISDATEVQMHSVEMKTLTDDYFTAADADQNGTVNVKDATAIQCYIAGLTSSGSYCGTYIGGTDPTTPVTTSPTPTTVPVTTTPVSSSTIYFNAGHWTEAGAWFSVYAWDGNGGETFVKMSEVESGVYSADLGGSYANVIFCRNDPAKTSVDWSSAWNQTADLTVQSGCNYFTINSGEWTGATGTWSVYGGSVVNPTTPITTTPTTTPVSGSTIYFNAGHWTEAGAWFSVYAWDGNGGETFVKMTEVSSGVYSADLGGSYSNVIFCRNDPAKTSVDWSSVWNQTADLTVQSGCNYFTINSGEWTGATGTWSTY